MSMDAPAADADEMGRFCYPNLALTVGASRGYRAFREVFRVSTLKQKISGVLRPLRASSGRDDLAAKLAQAERRIAQQDRELAGLRAGSGGGVRPENVVWIFGTARTGSTWLAFMMEELEMNTIWREPYVGELFGRLYSKWVGQKHANTKHFILGNTRESWLGSIRSFVLGEAAARFPEVGSDGYLVIKEPNGSVGAPLMMEALPESRLVFLVRDPRDVVASSLDAAKKGSWLHERRVDNGAGRTAMFDMQADALVKKTAKGYVQNVGNVREAYEKHQGAKVLIRYEDLRTDTLATMRRLYSELGIPVEDGALVRAVEKHAWDNVPKEKKGEGKFHRKAQPGGWREDLTPEQAEAVERITAPLL